MDTDGTEALSSSNAKNTVRIVVPVLGQACDLPVNVSNRDQRKGR